MAKKNHALDQKLIDVAKSEFMKNGYEKASIHEIVRKANMTTGALYTRYKGKDDLFCSLVQEVFDTYKENSKDIQDQYLTVQQTKNADAFIQTVQEEFHIYETLLKEHYDACVLFYCKSQGSSIDRMLKQMMDYKIQSTIEYFKSMAKPSANVDGVGFLILEQFHFFQDVLDRGYTHEQSIQCLKLLEIYQEAGWKAIFEEVLQ